MTGLLVSVRSGEEAAEALAGGAAMIDVKEPVHGSLGAADPRVWRDVCSRVAGRRPLSAALGELVDSDRVARLGQLTSFRFAKLGLAGCRGVDDWPGRWAALASRLPTGVACVAVLYADALRAGAPPEEEVLAAAERIGCRALLIDTFDKAAGSLFDHLSPLRLENTIRLARRRSMKIVLAGSLDSTSLGQALELAPDLVAVRGAACRGGRTAEVDRNRVRALVERLADRPASAAPASGLDSSRPACQATEALAGSDEKLAISARRIERGGSLWHGRDSRAFDGRFEL